MTRKSGAGMATRAGRYVQQPPGYRAFIPRPLPPVPAIRIEPGLLTLLSRADHALGRLDGVAETLPNPDVFVAMYVRCEAVLSSQIEGTQSTLEDVLDFELDPRGRELPRDVEEVVNYVRALNHGLRRLETLPLSLRLIREIHGLLLENVRGADRRPGEFRATQNWIGGDGATLARATFVPPPVFEMHQALDNFERFLHEAGEMPALIHCGLAHAQFETIHPFLDGNGRVGRLLITFLLCHRDILRRPLLYLSHYLKRHRAEYYDRLMAIRDRGEWEGWLRFFLRGVGETAEEATGTARAIVRLREDHRARIQAEGLGMNALRLHDLIFEHPLLNVGTVVDRLGVVFATAKKLIDQLETLGLLQEVTGGQRNRRYRYGPYLGLFDELGSITMDDTPIQSTGAQR